LRLVMVILARLVTVNAGGTFARLNETHLAVTVATSVGERIGTRRPNRRTASPGRRHRAAGSPAVATMTSTGNAKSAIAASEAQQKRRDAIAKARQEAADRLVELQGDRARLAAEGQRVAAQTGPAFLATTLGTDAETYP